MSTWLLIRCPPRFRITKIGVSEDGGAKMVSSENAQNIVLDIFWFVWNCWLWKFPVLDSCWQWRAILKGFDDIWRFLGGHLKKPRHRLLCSGAGCIHGCLVVWWDLGKTQMWAILLWCILKKATFENFVGVGAEDTICTICGQKWQNVHLHPFRFVGPNLHKIVFLLGVGLVVLFFGGGFLTWH